MLRQLWHCQMKGRGVGGGGGGVGRHSGDAGRMFRRWRRAGGVIGCGVLPFDDDDDGGVPAEGGEMVGGGLGLEPVGAVGNLRESFGKLPRRPPMLIVFVCDNEGCVVCMREDQFP